MRALEGCDVLLCPVTAIAAPRIAVPSYPVDENGQPVDIFEQIVRFTMPFDATGQPALAIPTGMSKKGLPLSMQFVGRPFDEMTVIRVADAYERARGPLPAPKL
jgi:Asp-tRNA(Asn)/Glu-tRNA(Gln) amidotransferase A subunit family amidase